MAIASFSIEDSLVELIEALLVTSSMHWDEITRAGFDSDGAGTGSTAQQPRLLFVQTGAGSSSRARLRSSMQMLFVGKQRQVINWSKRIIFAAMVSPLTSAADGQSWLTLGKNQAAAIGDPVYKAIGFRVNDLTLYGILHDGVDLVAQDLSVTLTADTGVWLVVVSDGAGNVEWFVNGVSKGISTAGPTGDGTTTFSEVQIETKKGAGVGTNYRFAVASIKLGVEQ